jgi:plasmid stability protein
MATLVVRNFDDRLYAALRARAAANCRSVGEEVEAIIRASLGRPTGNVHQVTRELLALAGSWQDDRPAEQIAAEIRKGRRTGRRFGNARNRGAF